MPVTPSRRSIAVSLAVAALAALTACAASQPAGLSSSDAADYNAKQYSSDDRSAATTLAPKAGSFLADKTTITQLASTTPDNGDVNPYAVLPVANNVGALAAGDVLVDNFNDKSNDQGTGTTIVDVHPDGSVTVFAALPKQLTGCPGGVGLTTAMVQLASGWVIVGSAPTTDGKMDTAGAGCLIELSPGGQVGGVIADASIDGPWDATLHDDDVAPALFVANTYVGVGSGGATVDRGTVVRIGLTEGSATVAPTATAEQTVLSGLPERADASALVKGPTGLALAKDGTLLVADNLGNRVLSVPDALTASAAVDATSAAVLSSGGQLAGPLGMALAPNGDLLVANAVNGKIVEISASGTQLGEFYAIQDTGQDPPGNGDLFGIAISHDQKGVLLVGDDNNDLLELH